MFEKLNLKQKIVILVGVILVIIGVCIFFLFQEEREVIDLNEMINLNENLVEVTENSEIEENIVQEEKIIVHITGEVKNEGILSLEKGARIADAIIAAGGETEEADLNEINLAYLLQDGQKIYIPNKKDKEENKEIVYITTQSGNNVIKQESTSNKGVNEKVNINKASQSELETLPGIGSSIASRIIEYRKQNGDFQKIEDLQNVKGIGDAKFADIKDYVSVE